MLTKTLALAALLIATPSLARANNEKWVNYGVEVLENRMTSDQPIPGFVLERAKCIAALKVVKAGFIWGGEGSTGLVSCKTDDGEWSTPSFFNVGGVNFGIQIGVQWFESILVFIAPDSREILENATAKLGVDMSWAAGPVGEGEGAGDIPDAHVLSYSRTRGLYVGATVEGLVLGHANNRNREVYGNVTPAEILRTNGSGGPATILPFVDALDLYMGE